MPRRGRGSAKGQQRKQGKGGFEATKKQKKEKLPDPHDVFELPEEQEEDLSRYDEDAVESYEYELPSDFEDEEIDEDMAFTPEDYELYGDVGGTSSKGKRIKASSAEARLHSSRAAEISLREGDEEEEEQGEGEEGDEDEEGGIKLSDLLDKAEQEEREKSAAAQKGKKGAVARPRPHQLTAVLARAGGKTDAVAMDEDEEEEEEDAQRGEEEEEDEDEEEEEGQGGKQHDELVSAVLSATEKAASTSAAASADKRSKKRQKQQELQALLDQQTGLDESEFNLAAILQETEEELQQQQEQGKLQLSDLLAGLEEGALGFGDEEDEEEEEDEEGGEGDESKKKKRLSSRLSSGIVPGAESGISAALRKQLLAMKKASGRSAHVLSEPLPEHKQEEITRKAGYQEAKKKVERWLPIVKKNRNAEHLSFPLNEPHKHVISTASLQVKFKPSATSSLEQDLAALIEQYGGSEKDVLAREQEQLQQKQYTMEELEARTRELAKMKSLLFYHELKMQREARIKSKTYRKIKKKEKEKQKAKMEEELAARDPEFAAELQRKRELERARERLTLAHKNTGKWAKRMKRLGAGGGSLGQASKAALMEMLQRGQELKKKIQTAESDSEAEEDALLESDEEESGQSKLARYVQDALREVEEGGEKEEEEVGFDRDPAEAAAAAKPKSKGLMALKFMQRAVERQRAERAKLLKELESDLNASSQQQDQAQDQPIVPKPGEILVTTGEDAKVLEPSAVSGDAVAASSSSSSSSSSGSVTASRVSTRLKVTGEEEESEEREGQQKEEDGSSSAAAAELLAGSLEATHVGLGGGKTLRVDAPLSVKKNGEQQGLFEVVPFDTSAEDAETESSLQIDPSAFIAKPGQPVGTASVPSTKKPSASISSAVIANGAAPSAKQQQQQQEQQRGNKQQQRQQQAMDIDEDAEEDSDAEKEEGKERQQKQQQQQKKGAKKAAAAVQQQQEEEDDEDDGENPWANAGEASRKSQRHETDKAPLLSLDPSKVLLLGENRKRQGFDLLGDASQEALVRQAFAQGVDEEEAFTREKEAEIEKELPKWEDTTLPGWGHWVGEGAKPFKKSRAQQLKEEEEKRKIAALRKAKLAARKDAKLDHVIINEKKDKKSIRYLVPQLPHPYTSVEQFNRAMRAPIGPEWNTLTQHQNMVKPEVMTKPGTIIEPIKFNPAVGRPKKSKSKTDESGAKTISGRGAKRKGADGSAGPKQKKART